MNTEKLDELASAEGWYGKFKEAIRDRDEQHDHEKAILEDLLRECEPVDSDYGCVFCDRYQHSPDCRWAVAVGWK